MTAEEKEKLYTAIGYSGSSHNLALPKQVNTFILHNMMCGHVLMSASATFRTKFNSLTCVCFSM